MEFEYTENEDMDLNTQKDGPDPQEEIVEEEEKDMIEEPHVALERHTTHQNAGSIRFQRGKDGER